jgi:CheY-like chemotaxis protein
MTKVLVVDDDLSIGAAIKMILNGEGHHAVHAQDANIGVEMFESCQFDLVIVDIFMPGINGLEVITSVRGRAANIPIVAISGLRFRGALNRGPDFLHMAIAAGATVGLRKPFTSRQLVAAVQASLAPNLRAFKIKAEHEDHHDGAELSSLQYSHVSTPS